MTETKKEKYKREIITYYERTEWVYRNYWNLQESLGLHFGFWSPSTIALADAVQNQNIEMAEYAEIKTSDVVLDAGCGVGGSSIYLAKKIGCHVTGITLTPKQVITAQENAQKANVSHLTTFAEMDYTSTNFPEESFDAVWACESVCHSLDKDLFFKEASRLLRKGGRLIIADCFQTKDNLTKKEYQKLITDGMNGWSVDNMCIESTFVLMANKYHFSVKSFESVNDKVEPSVKILLRKLYLYLVPGWLYYKIGGITNTEFMNAYGSYNICKSFKKLWDYKVFYAIKE